MPAAKKSSKVWDNKTINAKSDSLRKTGSDYSKQRSAADAVEKKGGKVSDRFRQSMDSTAKAYNKRADSYAVGLARRDSADAVNELKRVKKGGAKAVGGELTPLPTSSKKKK